MVKNTIFCVRIAGFLRAKGRIMMESFTLLLCKEQQERFARVRSFLKSKESDSLTVQYLFFKEQRKQIAQCHSLKREISSERANSQPCNFSSIYTKGPKSELASMIWKLGKVIQLSFSSLSVSKLPTPFYLDECSKSFLLSFNSLQGQYPARGTYFSYICIW